VSRSIESLLSNGISPSVIAVVDPTAEGSRIYRHFRSLGIEKIDFLLPDVTYESKPIWFPNYQPGPCAAYLTSAFDAWMQEDNPRVSIRMFREMIRLIYGA